MTSVVFRCSTVVFSSFVFSVGVNAVAVFDTFVCCTVVPPERVTVMLCELVWRTGCAVDDCLLLIAVSGVVVFGSDSFVK